MSGAQIGAVVGGVIGFFFGAPQLGAAIGGLIGGWISPTQVNGPHIGDGAAQTSQEGQPIAWILGTCGWVQGNIVQKSERREVKKTDDGKGSGTEVNTFESHQDYCIMICESSETRDSLMVGVLIVRLDGKIVYDVRPDSNFQADNAKFLENHTFYDGNEAQLPDPTMEAITGVGNTPYYRGVFTMVARDINLTQYGDRIPAYEFVMVGQGDSDIITSQEFLTPNLARFADQHFPLVDQEQFYDFTGVIGTQGVGAGTVTYSADTIQEIIDYFTAYSYSGGGSRAPVNYLGYSAETDNVTTPGIGYDISAYGVSNAIAQPSVVDNVFVKLVYNDFVPDATMPTLGFSGLCGIGNQILQDMRGTLGTVSGFAPNAQYSNTLEVCPGDNVMGPYPLVINVSRKVRYPVPVLGDPCVLGFPTLLPDSQQFLQACDGTITPTPVIDLVTASFRLLQNADTGFVDMLQRYTQYPVGPIILTSSPDNNQAFWEARYAEAVAAGQMAPGLSYPGDYPVSASSSYRSTVTSVDLTPQPLTLATAITRICVRGGLEPGNIDVTEMTQDLLGYQILQSYNGADCLRPLMTGFTSFGSEFDAQIHFMRHGEDAEIVVDPQDFIQTGNIDKDTRDQPVEYPRLLSVTAIDISQDYTPRPQTERRITPDVKALGEEQIQVSVAMEPEYQRNLAAIGMKISWARAQGFREFAVPYAQTSVYLSMVCGQPFGLDGKRWIVDEMDLEDGEIRIKAVYDRQSAYTADVSATPALPPTAPPTGVGGITIFAAMNLPTLRPQDAMSGLYVAACGLIPSWPGCLLQMSTDGGANWTTAIGSMTQPSVIGSLTADLPLVTGLDLTSTLTVFVSGGELVSITPAAFAAGGNPAAVTNADDVSEVLNFQDADFNTSGDYDLTTLQRGGLGTTADFHPAGARFVQLDSVYFLPLDMSLAGQTILFRPVTFGTAPESNATYSIVFEPPTFIIDGGEVT